MTNTPPFGGCTRVEHAATIRPARLGLSRSVRHAQHIARALAAVS